MFKCEIEETIGGGGWKMLTPDDVFNAELAI